MTTTPLADRKPGRSKQIRSPRTYWIAGLAIVITAGIALLWKPERRARESQLTITAGSASGVRHSIAVALAGFSRQQNLVIDVVPTTGSRDALARVDDGELDMAFAQGGLSTSRFRNIRQVAVLHLEPLHLLVKPDPAASETPGHLTLTELSMRSKREPPPVVNVSTPGSGTNTLALELLEFFRMTRGTDYQVAHLPYSRLLDPDIALEDLPDAIYTVSSLPSPVAKHLIIRHGYRPVELPVSDAFRVDSWSSESKLRDSEDIVRRRVVETTIPAYTYQVNPPVPDKSIKTLGTRLHLVAHKDTPVDAIERVVETVYGSGFTTIAENPLSLSLLQTSAAFELHEGARAYLRNKTPIITEHVVEITEQLLAIMGTVAGGMLFVWQAVVFVRRRRRDRQFLSCVERVGEIEHRAMQFERNEAMTIDDLVSLQGELNQIKADMIRQFQKGDIDGAETLSGFLMHVNDANENLTRVILHERSPRPTGTNSK